MSKEQPQVGERVTYRHPAGPVEVTVTRVGASGNTLAGTVYRHGGLEPLELVFTRRQDGEWRITGAGKSARPSLIFSA